MSTECEFQTECELLPGHPRHAAARGAVDLGVRLPWLWPQVRLFITAKSVPLNTTSLTNSPGFEASFSWKHACCNPESLDTTDLHDPLSNLGWIVAHWLKAIAPFR